MDEHIYRYWYDVGDWNKPAEGVIEQAHPGIKKVGGNRGFADNLFIASIMGEGEDMSVLLLEAGHGTQPTRATLELVRDQINHHLEHHMPLEDLGYGPEASDN